MRFQKRTEFVIFITVIVCVWKMPQAGFFLSSDQKPLVSNAQINRVFEDYNFTEVDPRAAVSEMPSWQRMLCDKQNKQLTSMMDISRDLLPFPLPSDDKYSAPNVSSRNIFFIESSCNLSPLYRAWCSVESWAGLNSESDVWYIFTAPVINDPAKLARRLTNHYPNINIIQPDLLELFRDTPLWNLFTSNRWLRVSDWPPVTLSDMLRLVLVWKYGGFYTDTDIICVRSVRSLQNIVSLQSRAVNSNPFHCSPHHPLVWKLMEHVSKNFKGDVWGQTGPKAFTSVMKKVCATEDLVKVSEGGVTCENVSIAAVNYFSPLPFAAHTSYFKDGTKEGADKIFDNSFALHFWNSLSKNKPIRAGGHSILDEAAKRFCPITYHAAVSHSKFF